MRLFSRLFKSKNGADHAVAQKPNYMPTYREARKMLHKCDRCGSFNTMLRSRMHDKRLIYRFIRCLDCGLAIKDPPWRKANKDGTISEVKDIID